MFAQKSRPVPTDDCSEFATDSIGLSGSRTIGHRQGIAYLGRVPAPAMRPFVPLTSDLEVNELLGSRVDVSCESVGRQAGLADGATCQRGVLEQVSKESDVSSVVSQPVVNSLTRAAIFLVATINPDKESETTVRRMCSDLAALLRAVSFRDIEGQLSCVLAFGSDAWDRLFGAPRPNSLHPFREIRGVHHAVSTPGDILFHIRSVRMDLCFELATQIISRLDGAVSTEDEAHGFKYFDDRDLIGFVDGTENPIDQAAVNAAIIGEEDTAFAGGSYVFVQKYLHDLKQWNEVPVTEQEKIIGRYKLSNIELDDSVKPTHAHNALTTIIENDEQLDIVRDNMPFGDVGKSQFGTYFIGYARSPHRIEQMLQNMFVGRPPGNYDRLLDFSRAVTGTLFFVPSATFLDNVAADMAPPPADVQTSKTSEAADKPLTSSFPRNGSLGIGSLKQRSRT